MKEKRKEQFPKHMAGKNCGYHLLEDGGVVMAPTYVQQYQAIFDERHGVEALLEAVQNHCSKLLADIGRRKRGLWDRIADDYGLDKHGDWIIEQDAILRLRPKAAKDETK